MGAQHGIPDGSWMQQSFPTKSHASRFVMQVGEFMSCTPKIGPTDFGFSRIVNYNLQGIIPSYYIDTSNKGYDGPSSVTAPCNAFTKGPM